MPKKLRAAMLVLQNVHLFFVAPVCMLLLLSSEKLSLNIAITKEWMCIYIPHIYHGGLQFLLMSEIERQLVKAPLAAAISSYLISLTHPTQAWNVE